jgi:hypothetical protein
MRPKLIACLIWYEESATWLSSTVASLTNCCDRLIACDGCFALWKDSQRQPASGAEQAEAILETAHGAGLACTVDIPREPFYGNEVEKRAHVLRLASLYAEPFRDWVLVIDADMVVSYAAPDLRKRLGELDQDVAIYDLRWREDRHATEARDRAEQDFPMRSGQTQVRGLMRVLDNLRVEETHYGYMGENENGETIRLWGDPDQELADAADMTELLRLEHRNVFRGQARKADQRAYYRLRDQVGAERQMVRT